MGTKEIPSISTSSGETKMWLAVGHFFLFPHPSFHAFHEEKRRWGKAVSFISSFYLIPSCPCYTSHPISSMLPLSTGETRQGSEIIGWWTGTGQGKTPSSIESMEIGLELMIIFTFPYLKFSPFITHSSLTWNGEDGVEWSVPSYLFSSYLIYNPILVTAEPEGEGNRHFASLSLPFSS